MSKKPALADGASTDADSKRLAIFGTDRMIRGDGCSYVAASL
jgi:hypothetical protein